jgi:hypothetical protein
MRRGQAVKERRQREASERQAERDRRGDEGQLNRLIDKGHSHCREADRLREKIGGEIQETLEGSDE